MDYLKTLQQKIRLLLNKLDETKVLNESLESKNENLIKINKDLETKIKIIQAFFCFENSKKS